MLDLTGQVFSRWRVIGFPHQGTSHLHWVCQCECGTIASVYGGNLRQGLTKSCGCYDREVAATRMTKHGDAAGKHRAVEAIAYYNMISRCYNQDGSQYHDYGGRGITVCDEWRGENGYINFLKHVGRRPNAGSSIDRIDVNGNYEPGNVRWASRREQNLNRRLHKRNRSGLSGVYYNQKTGKWLVKITAMYAQKQLLTTNDYFEACCARKSAELTYRNSI